MKKILLILIVLNFANSTVKGQIQRKRVEQEGPIDNRFWAPTLITQSTGEHLEKDILNVTIMHSFGLATDDVITNFFGLDNVQNVRLGVDYGLTDRWSLGIGRSSRLNVVDVRSKYAFLHQEKDDFWPFSMSLKNDLAVITQENGKPLKDDLSLLTSVIVARKVNDQLSIQLSPMWSYFADPAASNKKSLFALGMGSEIHLSDRFALIGEYYPIIGKRNSTTHNAFSLGLNIDTGGHVFQLFITSTEWHLEQYVLATNTDRFWLGDFRFGFNVNRIFGL